MNTENLKNTRGQLFTYLQENGYSKPYINRIKRHTDYIINGASKWDSYEDVLEEYVCKTSNRESIHHFKTANNVVMRFDLFGDYPCGNRQGYFLRGSYYLLNDEYSALIDYYCKNASKGSLAKSTIYRQATNTASFLLKLQEKGLFSLKDVSESEVLCVLTNQDGSPTHSASYYSQLRAVFKECIDWNENCNKIYHFIPKRRRQRKNIAGFTPTERTAIKETLSHSEELTLRDKAVGTLLYYTGLRSSDIASMTLDCIDWDNDQINILQQKTGNPLSIPLSATVGNALFDYITEERGCSTDDHLFLSKNHPYGGLVPNAVNSITDKIYQVSGLRQGICTRRGTYLFRHNLATTLLENGTDVSIISSILGHSDPGSTDVYLSADFKHLKECAISIEDFPIKRKGTDKDE